MVLDPILQAIILGVFQGLTEFLPISSSAHLVLIPWLMGWKSLGIIFDVMIHGGTLVAVLIYFRKDWKDVIQGSFNLIRGKYDDQAKLSSAIAAGTLPAVFAALLFRGFIESYARVPAVTIGTLSLFGIVLWAADRTRSNKRGLERLTLRDVLLIGAAQSLALVPGVSRSAITISTALFLGFSRTESARFSFLLSGPIILLGTLKGILELLTGAEAGADLGTAAVLTGMAVSAVTGYLCIKYFLRFLKTHSFTPFVVYRIVLAGVILWFVLR